MIPYFAVYNALLCIMRAHIFGPNFQEKNLLFSFVNSKSYLFIFRNKTDYRIPGYYFAHRYHCMLSRVTLSMHKHK